MAARTLPDFKQPPVVEVAISVYFRPLAGMKTVHFGQFWEANREQYPKFEDAAPLIENINDLLQVGDLASIGSLKRVFMITSDDRYLMQVQQTAFVHNWRKIIKDTEEYPHFEAARTAFRKQFELFTEFVSANDLGALSATRYEVTYVNHLEDKSNYASLLDRWISIVRLQPRTERELLPEPRTMNSDIWFDLPKDAGTLRVILKEVVRAVDKVNVFQIEITAGTKAKPDFSDLDSWLEIAHEWIVKGFAEITTPEAHKRWERIV